MVALLAGCASEPERHPRVKLIQPKPDALAITTAALPSPDETAVSAVALPMPGSWPAPDWVAHYRDPQLSALVAEALANNPTVQVATARLDLAQAQSDQFDSLTGLQGSAGAGIERAQLPKTSAVAHASFQGLPVPVQVSLPTDVTPTGLFAGLTYEFDLWGKNAAQARGLLASRDAARIDTEQARLSLTVSIVTLYAELDRDFAQVDLLQQELLLADQYAAIMQERAKRGLDGDYDMQDAALKRSHLMSQQILAGQQLRLTQLQLGVLTGAGPERGLSLRKPTWQDEAALALPPRLPLDLLGRRPDIEAARLRAEAASANTDATRASFYPNIDLMGMAGLETLQPGTAALKNLLTASAGPAISLPIFQIGQLHAALRGNVAEEDIAVGLYNKTVEDALGDVASLLTSLRGSHALYQEQQQAVAHAERIVRFADGRERRGLALRKDVLSAQLALLDEQAQLLLRVAETRRERAALIGALGGGFTATPAPLATGAAPQAAPDASTAGPPGSQSAGAPANPSAGAPGTQSAGAPGTQSAGASGDPPAGGATGLAGLGATGAE